jgi:predicted ATPase/class 3 adenylate cyclase
MAISYPTGKLLPTGTVTFLFTDIEGSTPLWESHPEQMAEALQIHNSILHLAIEANEGIVFTTASHALKAAVEGQRALHSADWNELGALKVRMGLHTGEAELDPEGDEYAVSHAKNRTSRIMSAAHGGQILLSGETAKLVERALPPGISLKDLGEHFLKGMALPERLHQVLAVGLASEFPHPTADHGIYHNLPTQLTRFIGREKELQQVKALLAENRLVTLTGAGGVGKTRLALQVANEVLVDFPNGIWLVELAPLGEEDQIPHALADVLGVRPNASHSLISALQDFLRQKHLLLLLDNCEHLIEGCADLAESLLRTCPQVHILASSREALGVEGEVSFYVPSMNTPDPQHMPAFRFLNEFEAVQLFLDRAHSTSPNFSLTESNAESLARLCQRLDGIPLALELAAARLRVLSVEQIAARLDDRFRLLTGGSRRALPRHQTLQALIDWSYGLLTNAERVLFRRLCVFAGGWTLSAAEQVCADGPTLGLSTGGAGKEGLQSEDILDLLDELVTKSIVIAEASDSDKQRYRMLETIRQYAQQKLVETDEAVFFHDQHLDYFTRYAENYGRKVRSLEINQSIKSLDAEKDNLALALNWALESQEPWRVAQGLRIICALEQYGIIKGLREIYAWCLKGIHALPQNDPQWMPILVKAKILSGKTSYVTYGVSTDFSEAEQRLEESVAMCEAIGDQSGTAIAMSALGYAKLSKYTLASERSARTDDYSQALELGEQSLLIACQLNQPEVLTEVLSMNAEIRYMGAEYEVARAYCEQGLHLTRQHGDKFTEWYLIRILGDMSYRQEDFANAKKYYQELSAISHEWQSDVMTLQYATTFGIIAMLQHEDDQMRMWFQRSLALSIEVGAQIHEIFCLRMLSIALLHQGQPEQASRYLLESLAKAQFVLDEYGIRAVLVVMAGVAIQNEDAIHAMQLLGAAEKQYEDFFKPLDPWEQSEFNCLIAEGQKKLDKRAYAAAWKTGRQMSLEQALHLVSSVGPF